MILPRTERDPSIRPEIIREQMSSLKLTEGAWGSANGRAPPSPIAIARIAKRALTEKGDEALTIGIVAGLVALIAMLADLARRALR